MGALKSKTVNGEPEFLLEPLHKTIDHVPGEDLGIMCLSQMSMTVAYCPDLSLCSSLEQEVITFCNNQGKHNEYQYMTLPDKVECLIVFHGSAPTHESTQESSVEHKENESDNKNLKSRNTFSSQI